VFHHVMIARQGVTMRLYLDGVLERSQIRASQTNVSNTAGLMLGSDVCINVDKTKPFTGQLDELEIYSRALTTADALDIFKAGRLGRCLVPTVAGEASASRSTSISADTTTITQFTKPSLLISAFRLSGPGGANDWFVELFNFGATPVSTNGLTLGLAGQSGKDVLSVALPSDQLIAPYSTYLIAGSTYMLKGAAARANGVILDQQQAALPFERAAAVALFAGLPTNANRLDAASMSLGNENFSEGEALPSLNGSLREHAFMRRFIAATLPQDSQNNRADFVLVAPTSEPLNGQAPIVGSVAPRNRVMSLRQ
jgi:hypothetical protein